mmetsp:Transcript_60469/g.68961  ORF Transcript_60469/g.68961 Transcript_60469/m.68961 type:complete len:89 (-) Transcript_60469:467-733(-)
MKFPNFQNPIHVQRVSSAGFGINNAVYQLHVFVWNAATKAKRFKFFPFHGIDDGHMAVFLESHSSSKERHACQRSRKSAQNWMLEVLL